MKLNCLICSSNKLIELSSKKTPKKYHKCSECSFVFLDPSQRVCGEDEKKRYLTHENDINDPAYQRFVMPLKDCVLKECPPPARGLDFGSGSAPVLAHLLEKSGYEMDVYDPYFSPQFVMSLEKYDFIVACEVIEHLYDPLMEFKQLRSWLNATGTLVIKTHFLEDQDIHDWYYSKDPTHVCFYNKPNLEVLAKLCGFSSLKVFDSRMAMLKI
jgi:hypothetical protein